MKHPSTSHRATTALLLAGALALGLAACGSSSTSSSTATTAAAPGTVAGGSGASPKVVASTSWVGAVAKMAGASNITVIAPSNIQHPPDYDPKASDLAALSGANYILLAGFEGFAQRMKDAAGSSAKVETVTPDYDPAKLGPEVERLAAEWGTTDVAKKNLAGYTASYEAASANLKKTTSTKPQVVVAQMFVAGWAPFAGYEVKGTYGPEPTSPAKVAELAALKPTLVFENAHMGGGSEIAGTSGGQLVNLVNFPGEDLELMPVVEKNAATIKAAVGG